MHRSGGIGIAGRIKYPLQISMRRVIRNLHSLATDHGADRFEVIETRLRVDPSKDWNVQIIKEPGNSLVRFDHEHLDERMGECPVSGLDINYVSFFIEHKF